MLNNQLASFAASGQLSKQKPKPKPTLVDVEIAGKTVEMEIPLQPNDPNFTKEIDKRARAIERDMFKKKIITKMVGASNLKGEELRKQAAALRAKGDIQGASDLLGQRANLLATGQDQKPQSDKVGSTSVVGNLPPVIGVPLTIASKALNTKEAKAVKKTVGDAFAKAGTASAVANFGAGAALGKMAGLAIQGAGKMTGRDIPVMASAAEQVVSKSVPLASREGVKMLNPLESSIVELASNPDQYLARIDQEANKAKQGDALSAVTYALLVGGPVLDVLGGVGGAASIVERLTAKIGKKAAEKAAASAARFAEQVPDIDALGAQFRPLKPGQSTRGVNVSFRQPARAAEPVPASVPDASPVETLARIANDEPVLALPARSQFSQEVDELRRVAEQPPVAATRAPEVVQPAPVAQVANDPIDTLARIASDEPIPASQVSQPQARPEPYTPTTPSNDKWETALDVAAQDYHWDFNKVRPEDERLLRALANREGFDLPPIDSEEFLYVWDDFRDTVQRRQYQSQIDPMDVSADVAKELAEVVRTRGKRNRFLEVRKNSQNLWRSTGGRQMSWIRLEDLPEEYHSRAIENARNYVDGKRFIAGDVYKSFISRGGGNRESVSIYNGDEVLFREISERGLTPDELSANASKVWIPKQAVVDIYENARSTIREKKAIGKSEATATRGDLLQAIEHYNPKSQTNAIPIQETSQGVLRQERPQVGLQEMGKGNAEPQIPAKQGQAQEVVPEPGVNTGIKNAVQETEIEQGLIRSASPKFGKTQEQIKASIEGARGRTDYDQVAEQISKGESFNSNAFAIVMQGDREKLLNIASASKAHADAIARNAPQEEINALKRAFDAALDDRQAYLDKIQKGKSEWSNIGRTLAQEVEVDTGNVADVLQFAQAKKGSKLTDQEVVELRKVVDERNRQVAELETRLKEAENIALRESRVTAATRRVKRERSDIRSERKILIEDFLSEVSKASSYLAGASPEAILKFAKIVRNVIEEGYTTFDDIAEFLRKNGLPDTETDDVIKALAEPLPRKAKVETELTKLRREAKKIAVDARKAENQTEQAQKRLTKLKENTQKRIDSLQEQLNTGQYAEKQARRQTEADVELYRLRIKKRMLENQVKAAIEAKKPQSGASKVGTILTEVKLANPASRILDVASNIARATGYFGGNVPRSVMDAGIAKLTKGVQVESVITPERLRRIIGRAKERAKMEFEMIRKSQDPDTLKKFGTTQGPFSKAAGMGDVPFRSIYFETAVDQGAEAMARKALGEKAPKAQVADFRDQIIRDLEQYPELEAAAHEFSLYMTYNGNNWVSDIGGYIKRVALRGNEPAGVVYDELIGRFGRVITNVATDQVNRTPVGAVRGLTKILKDPKVIDPKTRLEAIELIGKGLIGTAFAYLGLKAAEKIPGQVKGERQKYVDYGDLGKVGGPLGPFLLGATIGKAMKLSDSQRDPLIARSLLNMPFETPFASNIKDLLGVAGGAMDFRQFAARKITNTVIPGGVRDLAERTDVAPGSSLMEQLFNTGKSIEREKYPKEKTREFVRGKGMQNKENTTKDFGKIIQGEFKSKIPGLRQQLPKKK